MIGRIVKINDKLFTSINTELEKQFFQELKDNNIIFKYSFANSYKDNKKLITNYEDLMKIDLTNNFYGHLTFYFEVTDEEYALLQILGKINKYANDTYMPYNNMTPTPYKVIELKKEIFNIFA